MMATVKFCPQPPQEHNVDITTVYLLFSPVPLSIQIYIGIIDGISRITTIDINILKLKDCSLSPKSSPYFFSSQHKLSNSIRKDHDQNKK